jgi:hypothetical protein
MNKLRFTLAAAVLGITLAGCAAEGPTAPARTPGHRAADSSSDTTQTNNSPVPTSTTPPPLPTDPPPPDERGGQVIGPGA